ncbi:MAG: HTTM domain-containing protein [Bradymonadia bacterium]
MTNSSHNTPTHWWSRWDTSVSLDSLACLRILFGVTMSLGTLRFVSSGWIEELFVRPNYFFKYPGFEWVPVWSPTGLYIHFSIALLSSLMVALGWYYRTSMTIFLCSFLGIQLLDASNYLNHYYLVLCVGTVLLCLPANGQWSIDAMRYRHKARQTYPIWGLYLLRFQVGIVYIYAAIAKLGSDWLFHAQPLSIWLSARQDLPVLGPLLASPYAAYTMSWGGLVYDASIVLFLLYRPTRKLAYFAVLGFHGMTFLLFDIGMFPLIMIVLTTIFFEPTYPRQFLGRWRIETASPSPTQHPRTSQFKVVLIGCWCAFHLVFPFRHLWMEHDVLWSEQGMRYSWRVMVREKMGSITYQVKRKSDGRIFEINPSKYLEPRQMSEMSGQPDLIRQLAFYVKMDFERRHGPAAAVTVRALVSLNGRAPALMIDPNVDLTSTSFNNDGWLLPAPTDAPLSPWGHSVARTQE